MPIGKNGVPCNPYNFRFIQDDPLKVMMKLWPRDKYTREQEEIAYSVWANKETFVKAANKMGKDFIAGRLIVVAFLTRWPCRIVTTSTKDTHLNVLWSEIHSAIRSSKIPLDLERGGPLQILKREIRKLDYTRPPVNGKRDVCPISYIMSMVANDASMDAMGGHHATPDTIEEQEAKLHESLGEHSGHHVNAVEGASSLPYLYDWYTMWVADEASGVRPEYYPVVRGWARRLFVFGNSWPCNTPFKWAFKGRPGTEDVGGDIKNPFGDNYIRKCLSLPVSTSPNVRFARAQIEKGECPTGDVLVPGVKTWQEFAEEDATWTEEEKCVRHNAEWYEGKDVLLFPAEWLDRAEVVADNVKLRLRGITSRRARAIGVDPAEGGDKTSLVAVDDYGVIEVMSQKTPDTSKIPGMVIAFMNKHGIRKEESGMVAFDAGGGGQQHADRLRSQGYNVRTIRFGAPISPMPKRAKRLFPERTEIFEDKYVYKNLRAQMYYELSQLLDPDLNKQGFGIPRVYANLRSELSPIPKDIDEEGRYYIRPKQRSTTDIQTTKKVPTLVELIGHSPDEADALVLAVYAMQNKLRPSTAGVLV